MIRPSVIFSCRVRVSSGPPKRNHVACGGGCYIYALGGVPQGWPHLLVPPQVPPGGGVVRHKPIGGVASSGHRERGSCCGRPCCGSAWYPCRSLWAPTPFGSRAGPSTHSPTPWGMHRSLRPMPPPPRGGGGGGGNSHTPAPLDHRMRPPRPLCTVRGSSSGRGPTPGRRRGGLPRHPRAPLGTVPIRAALCPRPPGTRAVLLLRGPSRRQGHTSRERLRSPGPWAAAHRPVIRLLADPRHPFVLMWGIGFWGR